jgi:hypothetical protein
MVECWAKALGGCSSAQSGEHLVSASLFQGKMVTVQGFHWCLEPKSVGLGSLTANILCTTHNSGLSPLDSAAQQTLDSLAEAARLSGVRAGLKPRRFWSSARYRVNGPPLERWFLKTTINLFHVVGAGAQWHATGQRADDPPAEFIEVVFGQRSIALPLGLYAIKRVGAAVGPAGHFGFKPVFGLGERLAGALFQFEGFDFLLWACKEPPPEFSAAGIAEPVYHLRQIRFTVLGASSHFVDLKW